MSASMATYKVELKDRSHWIVGLKDEFYPEKTDTMLIVRYDAGDCDTRMKNKENMHRALYDLYQVHDGLKEGDVFETEFGRFKCVSFHVVEG